MKIKIKSKKINQLLEKAFPWKHEQIPKDPLVIRQLKRLEKKTSGKVQVEQIVKFNSIPVRKVKKKHYEIWEL